MPQEKTSNDNLEATIAAAQAGDTAAFASLVRGHQDYLRAFVASRCSLPQDVDDLAQDAFVLAYNKLSDLKEPKFFRSWLSGIALNLVRNHRRKHQNTTTEDHDTLESLIDNHIDNHPDDSEESLTALKACLLKLEHGAQEMMRMVYSEGKSVKALTELYQLKHSTITMRLYRYRKLLAECITRTLTRGDHD